MLDSPKYLYAREVPFVKRASHGRQTIASDYKEFIVLRYLVFDDLGICGNYLVLSGDVGIPLVLEVTQSPGQGEVA